MAKIEWLEPRWFWVWFLPKKWWLKYSFLHTKTVFDVQSIKITFDGVDLSE